MVTVGEQCAQLARRQQFITAAGIAKWPDGTVTTRYQFQHALYQAVVYERVTASRRRELHQQIGKRLEAAYQERAGEIAAVLVTAEPATAAWKRQHGVTAFNRLSTEQ